MPLPVPLTGRRRELAAIARLLDRARDGAGGVLVVAGPPGSGKTALADAAVAMARSRGLPVARDLGSARAPHPVGGDAARPFGGDAARPFGGDAARSVDGDAARPVDGDAARPVDGDAARPGDDAGRGAARLTVLDDADRAEWPDVSALTGAVLLTTTSDTGHRPDLRLSPLTEPELAELLPAVAPDAVHAVWLASAGWPGSALDLAARLDGLGERDAVVELALTTPSGAEFLTLDVALIRLLESAATRPLTAATRARVLARLARELLGDPSAAARRRALVDEASALARHTGDPGTIAEVLDARLHALWDPAAAEERLATASEIVERARDAGDATIERRGLFWRFVALAELGDLDAAEAALTAYARAGELDGDTEAGVVALARQAMLAMIRGRFDLTEKLTAELAVAGHDAGLADTDRLTATLRGWGAMLRGDAGPEVPLLQDLARRLPGHFFEATAARALAVSGRDAEALLELDRLLPSVLAGTGPRWVGAVADLALVASHGAEPAAVRSLYDALYPYRGRLVVWGGANMITGPVDDYLARLARRLGEAADESALAAAPSTVESAAAELPAVEWAPTAPSAVESSAMESARSGVPESAARHYARAIEFFDRAVAREERLGALPWLAETLKARGRDGDNDRAARLTMRLYPDKSGVEGSDEAPWDRGSDLDPEPREDGTHAPRGSGGMPRAGGGPTRVGRGALLDDGGASRGGGGVSRGDGGALRGGGGVSRGDGGALRGGGGVSRGDGGALRGGGGVPRGDGGARQGVGEAGAGGGSTRPDDVSEWRLVRDGDDWRLEAGAETVRLKDVRGLHYLRTLVAAPGQEIAALDLVAGGSGLRVPPGEPVLDATARAAFRERLDAIERRLDAADRRGDVRDAERLTAERIALVDELRRAGGFGGRPRRQSAEAERARVNATRALQTVLTRLESAAPLAAAHLRASLRTGNQFRYQPAPGGPTRWRV